MKMHSKIPIDVRIMLSRIWKFPAKFAEATTFDREGFTFPT